MKVKGIILLLSLFFILTVLATSHRTAKAEMVNSCCTITLIDMKTGIVSAVENSSGKIFEFKLKIPGFSPNKKIVDPISISFAKSLKIGQTISADLVNAKVSINGGNPCCDIIKH